MLTDTRIVIFQADDVIQVPVGALFRDGDGWAAFVVLDRYACKRVIQVSRRGSATALVETGIIRILSDDHYPLLSAPFMLRQAATRTGVLVRESFFPFTLSLSKDERVWIILNWKPTVLHQMNR